MQLGLLTSLIVSEKQWQLKYPGSSKSWDTEWGQLTAQDKINKLNETDADWLTEHWAVEPEVERVQVSFVGGADQKDRPQKQEWQIVSS